MSIPKLEQCCCGCTLRTGTKIIGWLSLIGVILQLITTVTFILASYKMEDDANVPKETRDLIPVLRPIAIVMSFFYLFEAIMSCLLLMGAYQNKAHFVLWWVYYSTICLVLSLLTSVAQLFVLFNVATIVGMIIGYAIVIYLMLVVYNFYKEIQNGPGSYA